MNTSKLYHIVAMARNRVIGKDNKLPWHFSSDLKHFKQITMGHTVIMGRKTYESIGKPLPGRVNFVLTRHNPAPLGTEGISFFNCLSDALEAAQTEKVFIIGGEELYRETLDRVDGIILTHIDAEYIGDAFYPEIPAAFYETSRRFLQDQPKIEVITYEKNE